MTEELEVNKGTTATQEPAAAPTPAPVAEKKVMKQEKVGKVVSDKMNKTIVVEVSYLKKHRLYKKAMRRTSRFKAHDEENQCKVGDTVRIIECPPFSKDKHFRLAEIIKKGVAI